MHLVTVNRIQNTKFKTGPRKRQEKKKNYFLFVSFTATTVLSCKSIFRYSLKAKCTEQTTHDE